MKPLEIAMIVVGGALVYSGVRDFRWLAFLQNFAITQDPRGLLNHISDFYGDTSYTTAQPSKNNITPNQNPQSPQLKGGGTPT
jgi:hypothetical protein